MLSPLFVSLCHANPFSACAEENEHLLGLDLADSADGNAQLPIDMLIGCDYYWDLVTGRICRNERGPTAIHTKLGWVLSGPTLSSTSTLCSTTNFSTTHLLRVDCQMLESKQLDEQLESLGIHEEEKTLYDDFTSNITFKDGRYKVLLPWKEFHEPLPDNYLLSLKRLRGLLCRLKHDPTILKEYNDTIQDQVAKGIIEPVPPDKTNAKGVTPSCCCTQGQIHNQATGSLRCLGKNHWSVIEHNVYTRAPSSSSLFSIYGYVSDHMMLLSLPTSRKLF